MQDEGKKGKRLRGLAKARRRSDHGPSSRTRRTSFHSYAQTPDILNRRAAEALDRKDYERIIDEVMDLADQVAKRENKESMAIKKAIAAMPGDYSTNVNRILFGIWVRDYDAHMADHVKAMAHLTRKAVLLQSRGERVFGNRILDVSSGTGSVIDLICRSVPPELARQMQFIANDISPEMQEGMVKKIMALPPEIRPLVVQRYEDMRALTLKSGSVHTSVMGQSFHLITDPAMGPLNGAGNHNQKKAEVLESMYDITEEDGYAVIMDEWKPILTRRAGMEIIDTLFHEIFKPMWEKYAFIEMMKRIRMKDREGNRVFGARMVAELKAWIDPDHRMYIFIYKKDIDKMYNRGIYLPDFKKNEGKREEAVGELIERFKLTDREFVKSFAPDDTEGKKDLILFEPFEEMKHIIVDMPRIDFQPGDEAIIFTRVLHDMPDSLRDLSINNAIKSRRKGGVVIFIDEFHHPMKSATQSSKPHPYRKSSLRGDLGINYERDLLFEGALRVPIESGYDSGMYGFMYRKIVD